MAPNLSKQLLEDVLGIWSKCLQSGDVSSYYVIFQKGRLYDPHCPQNK